MNFREGQKVRSLVDIGNIKKGDIGTILEVDPQGPYPVTVDFPGEWIVAPMQAEEFEVIESAQEEEKDERVHFEGGGMRDSSEGKPRFDLLVTENVPFQHQMLTRYAIHLTNGASKYAPRNWEEFSDEKAYNRARESAFRHFMQWFTGEDDEDHAAAVWFNIHAAEHIKGKLDGKY